MPVYDGIPSLALFSLGLNAISGKSLKMGPGDWHLTTHFREDDLPVRRFSRAGSRPA